MKKYIVLLFTLFLSILFLGGCIKKESNLNDLERIKKRGYLIAGVKFDSPPFGYLNKAGNLAGIDVELARLIANNIFKDNDPSRVQFVKVTPQNRIATLNSKEVDILIATMSINEKRKLVINFSSPYFVSNQKLMVRADSKISHLYYFNKSGRLCVIMGTTGEKISRLIIPNAYIVGAKTYPGAYELLKKGQVEGILGDDSILEGINGQNKNYKIINKSYSSETYGVATRKSKSSESLLELINQTINLAIDKNLLNIHKKNKILEEARQNAFKIEQEKLSP